MKKVLALMVGCALSGTLFAGHKTGQGENPIDGKFVTDRIASARAEFVAFTREIIPVEKTYRSTCANADGKCLVFPSTVRVNGAMRFMNSNIFNIPQPVGVGVEAADAICQAEMDAQFGEGHHASAWISDSTRNAAEHIYRDRITYVTSSRQMFAAPGTLLRKLANPSEQVLSTPVGPNLGPGFVFTGTTAAGVSSGKNCNNWTSADAAAAATVGLANSVQAAWTEASTASCNTPAVPVGSGQLGFNLVCVEHLDAH